MFFNRDVEPKEERFVPYQPPHLPPIPIDLTGGMDEGSDFSGSEDEHENDIESDTEETSDENSPEPRGALKSGNGNLGPGSNADENDMVPENRFLQALMNAAQSYSNRLRVTAMPNNDAPSSAQSPPITVAQPSLQFEASDEDENKMEEFSDDEDCKDDYLPSLSPEDANRLFYKPVGKWAEFADCPIENPITIAKLNAGAMCEASIKQGTLGGRKITYISKTWLRSQKWEGFFSEMMLYADPSYLRPLQGKVIPEIIGLYLVNGAISVAMELPSSTFWVEASEDMSDHLKRKCIAAFDEVHARGVLHDDVELRHMLVSASGQVTLIDFQMSRALKPKYEVELQRATEDEFRMEKRKVLFKLDYDNAQRKESIKRARVKTRWERNIERKRRRKLLPPGTKLQPEDEYERDEEDDIVNPIVDDMIWLRQWLGDEFEPSCYVVPGQDEQKVEAMLKDFAMREITRLDEEKEREDRLRKRKEIICSEATTSHHHPTNALSLSSSSSSTQSANSAPADCEPPNTSILKDEDKGPEDKGTSSARVPALLPMRVSSTPSRGTKRPRDSSEDDTTNSIDGNCADDSGSALPPAPKKRLTDSIASSFESSGSLQTSTSTIPSSAVSIPPTSIPTIETSSALTDPLPSVASSSSSSSATHVFPFLEERESVIVPYDDYTGFHGGKLVVNRLCDEELAEWRRHWIRQDNMRQFREEGVIHPMDDLYKELIAQMDSESDEATNASANTNKNKRKRKGMMGRGAVKRFKRELEAPGVAKMRAFRRKERYFKDRARELGWDMEGDDEMFSDSDDGNLSELGDDSEAEDSSIPEGPRILSWTELEAREAERSGTRALTSNTAFSLSAGSAMSLAGPSGTDSAKLTPARGILRRRLTKEEIVRQRAFEETLVLLGQHPNQLNVIDEDAQGNDDATAEVQNPKFVPRTSSTELPPLMKAYTEASDITPVSSTSSTTPSPTETAAETGPMIPIYPPKYTRPRPPSHMFAPRKIGEALAFLTRSRRRPAPPSRPNSLLKMRPPRIPASSICAITGAVTKFPPSPPRKPLPPFPAGALFGSSRARAFTIPYSTAPSSPSLMFPAPSVAPSSALAQAPQCSSASGSNITLENLNVGSLMGTLIPGSATVDGEALPTDPGAKGELIGVASPVRPDGHVLSIAAAAPLENSELESEDGAVDEGQVEDDGDLESIPLSSHIQSIAKALIPWLR